MQLEVTSLTFLNRASQLHFERQTDLRFRWFLAGRLGNHWQLRQRWGTGPYCYSNAAPVEFYRSVWFFLKETRCLFFGGLGSWILAQLPAAMFQLLHLLLFEWAYPYMFQHHLLRKLYYCLSLPDDRFCCEWCLEGYFLFWDGATWKVPCSLSERMHGHIHI